MSTRLYDAMKQKQVEEAHSKWKEAEERAMQLKKEYDFKLRKRCNFNPAEYEAFMQDIKQAEQLSI